VTTSRHTLLSVRDNVRVGDWRIDGRALGIAAETGWSVRTFALHGGKQEGVDLIELDNGRLRCLLVPARGMGVLRVQCGGVRLGWDSPIGEVVHPAHVALANRGGLGWLEGFNEWLVRCGLEWAGAPGEDRFVNNNGDEATMALTLHGRIANTPASEVEVVVDREPPHRIRVRGRVDERCFYGPQLELWTELSTEPGSSELRIEDTITNRGGADQEFQLVYHINQGPPVLEQGARFIAAIRAATPFNDVARRARADLGRYPAPTPGFVEQLWFLQLAGDDGDDTLCMLRNAEADKAVSLGFSLRELPCFSLWKNALDEVGGYVTGFEPGTSFPNTRRVERAAGRVPVLRSDESRRFALHVAVHEDARRIAELEARIAALSR
jgi:hypothetical protein